MTTAEVAKRSLGIWFFSILALAFGLLTLKSGGTVLFIEGEARQAAGNYVPFVLWFNFSAGLVYVITGIALWLLRPWAFWLSVILACSTLIVFAAFGLHILNGGAYEMRTVVAMSLRSGVWLIMVLFIWNHFFRNHS